MCGPIAAAATSWSTCSSRVQAPPTVCTTPASPSARGTHVMTSAVCVVFMLGAKILDLCLGLWHASGLLCFTLVLIFTLQIPRNGNSWWRCLLWRRAGRRPSPGLCTFPFCRHSATWWRPTSCCAGGGPHCDQVLRQRVEEMRESVTFRSVQDRLSSGLCAVHGTRAMIRCNSLARCYKLQCACPVHKAGWTAVATRCRNQQILPSHFGMYSSLGGVCLSQTQKHRGILHSTTASLHVQNEG